MQKAAAPAVMTEIPNQLLLLLLLLLVLVVSVVLVEQAGQEEEHTKVHCSFYYWDLEIVQLME